MRETAAAPGGVGSGPAMARGGMVASTDGHATRVGVEVLRLGGNAVDAAVAVGFALAVVNPEAGNLGGGGYLLLRRADGTSDAFDFRSTAPAAATRDMFLDAGGNHTGDSEIGHLAVAVPGSVRGLWEAHRADGLLPWAALLEPAIALAEGFPAGDRLLRSYTPRMVDELGRFPSTAEIFLPGGRPPRHGARFRQAELVRTLERIRDGGADGFYLGETADLIVDEMKRGGGLLTHSDLAGYGVARRRALALPYRDHTLLSMPPSSSGGVTLAATCSILASFPLRDLAWHGPEHVHLLAESWRRAFADRNRYLADPAFHENPVETLVSRAYGAWRSSGISGTAATPSAEVEGGVEAFARRESGRHTTHVSVVDRDGAAVSFTTTLNTWYGSKLVARGTGVLLNNEMDDFTSKPGTPNHFGLVQGEANAIEPGKRMLSAMTPTIVLDPRGRLKLVVGTPGGATIITTVFQVVSNLLDHGMSLAQAVRAPRVHHQHLPDRIEYEPNGLDRATIEKLERWGHDLRRREEPLGDVQAVLVEEGGTLLGMSDPRRGGVAAGP